MTAAESMSFSYNTLLKGWSLGWTLVGVGGLSLDDVVCLILNNARENSKISDGKKICARTIV